MHTQKLFILITFVIPLHTCYKTKSLTKIAPYAAASVSTYCLYKIGSYYYQQQSHKAMQSLQDYVDLLERKYQELNPTEHELAQKFINKEYQNCLSEYYQIIQHDHATLDTYCKQ